MKETSNTKASTEDDCEDQQFTKVLQNCRPNSVIQFDLNDSKKLNNFVDTKPLIYG